LPTKGVRLLRLPRGWQHRRLVTRRMLYLIFVPVRVAGPRLVARGDRRHSGPARHHPAAGIAGIVGMAGMAGIAETSVL
jgi:hypothetical protein